MAYSLNSDDISSWENEGATQNVPQGTSPGLLSQGLNNIRQAFTGNLQNAVNSPGVQGILGAGDAWRNAYASGLNMLPGVNIPMVNNTNGGMASSIGRGAGTVGSFMAGGEGLDAFRAGMEGAPIVGGAAQYLGGNGLSGVLRRGIGSAAYGAATDQNNRLLGGTLGAALSPAADMVPGIASKISDAAQYFMPTQYMKGILQNIGGGQTLEDATKSFIGSVQKSYQDQKDAASELYDPVYSAVRDRGIYNPIMKPDPLMSLDAQAGYNGQYHPQSTKFDINSGPDGRYPNLDPGVFSNYSNDLKNLHTNFLENPTFDNAHKLQSQIGIESASLNNGISAPDVPTLNAISSLNQARGALKTDMSRFLQRENPDLLDQYNTASEYFRDNVAPYRANPKIYGMATGDITNIKPSSLGNVFAGQDSNVQTVTGHLPQNAIDNLMYTKLGQRVPSTNADAFMRNFQALDQQGLTSAISPDLSAQVSSLQNRMHARNSLQMALGGLLGAGLGGAHGVGPSVGLGMLGAGVGKPIMNYIQARLPMEQIAQTIGNAASAYYPALRTALLSNSLNQSGGNQ